MAVSRLTQTTLQNGLEKYNQVWDGRSAVGSMEPISAITLSAAQSSVEFNNIPGTYSHLQIRILSRDNRASTQNNIQMIINNDDGTNYTDHYLVGDGSTASSGGTGTGAGTYPVVSVSPGTSSTANIYAISISDILDYASTNKYKTIRSLHGNDQNGSGTIRLRSSVWLSNSAITSLRLFPAGNASFVAYSSFSLYGIK
jgi:hypothetical protein